MNIYQRAAIMLGAVVIALLFFVYPHKYEQEVSYHAANRANAPVYYQTETRTDYKTTALEGVAVGALTAGLVVLLGAVRRK